MAGLVEDFTTTALLASIKRRGMLPSTSDTLSTTDFLAFATEEMRSYCLPLLVSLDEEYGVSTYTVALTSGTASYLIPPRASGDSARVVEISSGSGYTPITRISPTEQNAYALTGDVQAFFFNDDYVTLVPTPTSSSTLRIKYIRRPNALVQATTGSSGAIAIVSAINTGTKTITTTATVPSTYSTSVQFDLIRAKPGFPLLAIDQTVTSCSGTTIIFSDTLPTDLAVGDYVCRAGESPVPQIPVELHPLLAQRTKFACLEALGDQKAGAALASCERMKADVLPLLTPRSKGNSRPIVNRFGPGWR